MNMGRPGLLSLLCAGVALGMAACSLPKPPVAVASPVPAPLPPAPPAAPPPVPQRLPPAGDPLLERFVADQLLRAQQAARGSRLADAALAWEALSLAVPESGEFAAGLAQARQAIAQAVAQRMAQAAAARQRGDTAMAEQAWLETLAFDPSYGPAAAALRMLERERHHASTVGRFSAPPGSTSRAFTAAAFAAPAPADSAARGRLPEPAQISATQRNQLEHASLMASQGHTEAAITLLDEQLQRTPQDGATRAMLASLHVQRAEQRSAADRKAAIADLVKALQLNPRLDAARERLLQLQKPAR